MSERSAPITVTAECRFCNATGLYMGMAERKGIAVVCKTCRGTGAKAITYTPYTERQHNPEVTSVHVSRGYGLSPEHPGCQGGMPYDQWRPGVVVPADEQLYCPYLYTKQDWCAAFPHDHNRSPVGAGECIDECPQWEEKAACWRRYHETADAPQVTY